MSISEECIHEMDCKVMLQYETDELGIPLVIFNSVQQSTCKKCGEITHLIPFPDRLIAAAAIGRCKLPLKFSGDEIRFIRKAMNVASKDLAEILCVAPETFSRWENDKAPIAPASEKMLRIVAWLKLGASAPAIDFDPREIMDMPVKAIRGEADIAIMGFELVRFKNAAEKPTTEVYTEGAKEAA